MLSVRVIQTREGKYRADIVRSYYIAPYKPYSEVTTPVSGGPWDTPRQAILNAAAFLLAGGVSVVRKET
jgi:hypothetical protein